MSEFGEESKPTTEQSKPLENDPQKTPRRALRKLAARTAAAVSIAIAGLMPGAVASASAERPSHEVSGDSGKIVEDNVTIKTRAESVYKIHFKDTENPGELDDVRKDITDFTNQVDEAVKAGYTIKNLTIGAQETDTARMYDEDQNLGGLGTPDAANVQLAQVRRDDPNTNNLLTQSLDAVAQENHVDLPTVTKGPAVENIFTQPEVDKFVKLAGDNGYGTAFNLITAYNEPSVLKDYGADLPTQMNPAVRAEVDKLLDDRRWVELTAEAIKTSVIHSPEAPPPPILIKHIKKDVAVPAYMLAPVKPPGQSAHAELQQLASQHTPDVAHHNIQPRNQNFHKEAQSRGGRMERSHGGDRSGKR